jgi:hypothetical protein
MPLSTVFILIAVVAMFALFAAALAWAQFQARDLTIGSTEIQTIGHPKRRPF